MADPESEPQPQPSVRLDKLSLDDLFKRTEALEAAGMSREAAKLAITSSKLITEWTVAGPFEGLEVKLSKVDQSVQSLQSTVFVLTVLVVFALCCLDFTTLENNIIGMLLKSVFSL